MSNAPATADLWQYAASVTLVLVLLVGLLWSLRKLQRNRGFGRREQRLQIVESMALGARHKVALIRVDHREVLVGITAQQITTLASWVQTPQEAAADFNETLARARAQSSIGRDTQ